MIKVYCDRCGKEIEHFEEVELSAIDDKGRIIKRDVEVCDSCSSFIKRSLRKYNINSNKMRADFCETLMDYPRSENDD